MYKRNSISLNLKFKVFIWLHLGILNVVFTIFDTGRLWVFEDISALIPFKSIYHPRTLVHREKYPCIDMGLGWC